MLFPTVTFAVFFVVVYGLHTALASKDRRWKLAMLAASYVFYGWWDWRFCGLLAASSAANWLAARPLAPASSWSPSARRALLAATVAANLAVLGLFKYYAFALDGLSDAGLGMGTSLPAVDVILPVGISFFTFQALSYVIDVHRGQIEPRGLLDVALFLAFFPQLVAGPIVRAADLLPQLVAGGRRLDVDVAEAGWLIGRGLFKKVVVAGYLAETVVDPVFAAPSEASKVELLLAIYGYAIQIYADFSGYTDIAIGVAALLGIRFPANFDRPYRALSVQDFWRRWHLSLSRWLRDYLYIPLGGNRRSAVVTYRNLMITMVLGGLWHGAAWTFVAWGALHGLALSLERAVSTRAGSGRAGAPGGRPAGRLVGPLTGPVAKRLSGGGAGVAFRWLATFHLVCGAWVLFRAGSIEVAGQVLGGLMRAPFGGPVNLAAMALVIGALAAQWMPEVSGDRLRLAAARLAPPLQAGLAGAVLAAIVVLSPDGVDPFIYFQF